MFVIILSIWLPHHSRDTSGMVVSSPCLCPDNMRKSTETLILIATYCRSPHSTSFTSLWSWAWHWPWLVLLVFWINFNSLFTPTKVFVLHFSSQSMWAQTWDTIAFVWCSRIHRTTRVGREWTTVGHRSFWILYTVWSWWTGGIHSTPLFTPLRPHSVLL